MSSVKTYRKGEFLFREGDKIQFIHLIQQGAVSLCIVRPKKNVDLFQLGPSHLIGELSLLGASTYPYSAVATQESKVLELPVDLFRQQVDAAPQMVRVLAKSLSDRLKVASAEVKSTKMEKDNTPCPDDLVAKVFGSVFHTANHKGKKGEKDPTRVTIDWTMMKQYAQRVFAESPKRLEQAICILVKLKLADFEMGKPPDDPEGLDQIQTVNFFDLSAIEAFFEFYQYHYFKGTTKGEILKNDDTSAAYLNQLLVCAEGAQPDRFGIVSLDFGKTVERFKADLGVNLNQDHFARLEQKGIFVKRGARQDGSVVLQYEIKELQTTQKIWRILKEIEKWNEKGLVDMNEDEVKAKKKTDGPTCPSCAAPIQNTAAKFCSECGAKIAAAA